MAKESIMKRLAGVASLTVALAMLPGCGPNSRMYDVTGEEFLLYYGAPGTQYWRYQYRGLQGDYHVIDYYGWGSTSFARGLVLSMRAHKDDLPPDFPTEPQPPEKDANSLSPEDQQYLDMLLQFQLSDANSIPLWAWENFPLPGDPPGGW
jgi:hypothetical protein